ncbi:MAG: Xaa-Pro aminopeptidase, partial [Leeuwenhoekiella sp.]
MFRKITFFILLLAFSSNAQILSERERAALVDQVLKERFETVLPNLMYRTGIDMWVLISREYNEDPVLKSMLPAEWLNARRRTILVFYWNEAKNKLEKMAVARYDIGDNINSVWDKEKQPDQWKALSEIIEKYDPKKIGLNYSEYFGLADGIVKTDYETFLSTIPQQYKERIVSAEKLAIGWLETRTPLEMRLYEELVDVT